MFPSFLWCEGEKDLLKLLRQQVRGMSTPQVYMKVPGSWTGGHEENCRWADYKSSITHEFTTHHRFRSINLNMGPEDSEWFAIGPAHSGELRRKVLEIHGIDIYLNEGVWFPTENELRELDIPYTYSTQSAGDCVVLDGSTLHWVRALGFSLHFSWNFGVVSANQYLRALERYDENVRLGVKNLVPMQTLTFDLLSELENTDSVVAKLAWKDPQLVLVALERLLIVANDLGRGMRHAIDSLKIDWTPEQMGCMVVRCQNPSCQMEIFGAYLACLHCRLCCINCAARYCRRYRNIRPLSYAVYHEKARIYIKDDLQSVLDTADNICDLAQNMGFSEKLILDAKNSVKHLRKTFKDIADQVMMKIVPLSERGSSPQMPLHPNSSPTPVSFPLAQDPTHASANHDPPLADPSSSSETPDSSHFSTACDDFVENVPKKGPENQAISPPLESRVCLNPNKRSESTSSRMAGLPERVNKSVAKWRMNTAITNRKRRRLMFESKKRVTDDCKTRECAAEPTTLSAGLIGSADSSIAILKAMIENSQMQLDLLMQSVTEPNLTADAQVQALKVNIQILTHMQDLANQLVFMTNKTAGSS